MGKILNERDQLSKLLDGVQKETKPVSIDENKSVLKIKPKTKKTPEEKKEESKKLEEYCGIMIPEQIFKICKTIESALQSQGKYTQALDFQIFNCAVQLYTYGQLVKKLVKGDKYVATRELTTCSESYRRSLQYCGLTIDVKKGALNAEDAIENNPLANFLSNLDDDNTEKQIVKKKKSKKKKED